MTGRFTDSQAKIYKRRWWTLAVLSMSLLIIGIDNTILNVALPTLQREINATGSELQWIVDAYVLAFAALLLTMGALGDRFGRARLLRIGIFIFGAASFGATFADSASQLAAARAVMGLGASMIMPATLAIISNVFPREERGKAIGAWGAVTGAAIALGPITGGILLEHFYWGSVFFINVPVVAIALIAGLLIVPNSRDPNPKRPDIAGTILSSGALSLLVFGLIKGGDWGWRDSGVVGALAGAVIVGMLFVLWERHTAHPMLDLWLFRNPRFSTGVTSITMLMLCQMGMVFGITQYMQFVLGFSALETGIRLLPSAAGVAIGAVLSHRRVGRFGTTRVMTAAFVAYVALFAGASFWEVNTSYWVLGPMFFVMGMCMGHIMPPATDALLGAVPEARSGVGSAMNSVSVQVGGAIGVAALGSVLSSVYSSNVKLAIAAIPTLPVEVAHSATDSVGMAIIVSDRLPDGTGQALSSAARESFMDGWQIMALVVCGIGFVAAIFVMRFMPPRHLPLEAVEDEDPAGKAIGG